MRALATAAAACVLALLVTGCGAVIEVAPIGEVTIEHPAETSVVVDRSGRVLAELHAEQDRDVVGIEAVPQVLLDAVVAVEDARFRTHSGVDLRAVVRAFVENASEGRVTQGGSTITQQLAKNVATGDAQTLRRKLEEASVAYQLERQFTKDEILAHYLNTVYFGNGAYGVQAAARTYFGTDVGDLDLPRAALLAGLLKAPSTYDPLTDPDAATARRGVVLGAMERNGYIDAATAERARSAPLGVEPTSASQHVAPYFVAHVLDLLQHNPRFAALGDDATARADRIFRGGLRIETTLDPHWQGTAEHAVAATLPEASDPHGALVAIDPATGGIRALVGGRDYYDADDPVARFNLATQALRQPGSTFKTVALVAALASGATLEDRFPAPGELTLAANPPEDPRAWTVRNYSGDDFGDLSLREATVHSVNTVYAQVVDRVGPEEMVRAATALGVDPARGLAPYRSIVLGAQEVTVLDMASVQATLAAGGVHRSPTAVTRIVAPDGTVLYERGTPRGVQVIDEGTAWLVTQALTDVIAEGTGRRAAIGRPVAGKTGTTQSTADAWFAGYTPDLAAAVWIGFPEGRVPMVPPRTRTRVEGGAWPAEVFARFSIRALEDVVASSFPVPEARLVRVAIDVEGDCLPGPWTPRSRVAQRPFLIGTEPTQQCPPPPAPPVDDVPDLVGREAEAARTAAGDAGFGVRRRQRFDATRPPGYVLAQEPAPGPDQILEDGYEITLWVSSADRTPVRVPDVLNLPVEAATEQLEQAGFVVEVEAACPDLTTTCTGAVTRPGFVWEQSPDTNAQVPVHSVVTLRAYPAVEGP